MKRSKPLFYLGTAALLSLASLGTVSAQEVGQAKAPQSLLLQKERLSPNELQARQAENRAKHPLLYQRRYLAPSLKSSDGLTRLKDGAPMAVPTAPAVSNRVMRPAAEDGRKLWGNVLFDNTWAGLGTDYTAYGWYEFMAQAPVKVSSVFNFDFLRATGSGAWIGNMLYYVWYQNFWGVDMIYYYKINTDTWEQEGVEETLPDCSLMANETAIAPDGTTVYGDYLDADGMNNELCIVDYETKERTKIGTLRQAYVAMGMTSDSRLYGVAVDGNLYQIDTQTAEERLVGSTGVQIKLSDGSFYYQSGEIDQKTNTFYWACVDANANSTLYTVNLEDGSLSLVGEFEGGNMITMLSIPKPLAEDDAPAAATGLQFDFAGGSLTGDVCFKAPTTTFAGGTLTGSLSYTITDGKQTLATGTTTPGADVRQQVTLPGNGTVNFVVTTSNDAGTSPKLLGSTFVGYDVPASTGNVNSTLDAATGQTTVSWSAPTTTLNGGYMGALTYDVVRYPEGKVVKTGFSGTSFTDQLPTDAECAVYGYGVTPVNGSVRGEESVSNYVSFGKPITPPFLAGFDEESEMALYNVVDVNGDGVTWTWEAPSLSNDFDGLVGTQRSENGAADDWIIMPAVNVRAGHVYEVSFRISGQSKYYTQKFEVKYGTTNSVDGMTETLVPLQTLETSDYQTMKATIIPDKDKTIYIGVHDNSGAKEWGLKLDDVMVSAGVSLNAPDSVTNLQVTPAAKGALSATVSFDAPAKRYGGGSLDKVDKYLIRRNGTIVGEAPGSAPSAPVSFVDNTPTNGFNVYSVAAVNSDGTSFYCPPVAVYVGVAAPTLPGNRRTEERPDKVVFSWTAPEKGLYDAYVNPAELVYTIAEQTGSDWYPSYDEVASVKGATTIEVPMVTNTGDQTVKTLWLSAKNEYGSCAYRPMPSIMLGKPYEIPFAESVSQKMLHGRLWTTDKTGDSDFWISDDEYPDCVDNDNGSFYMKSENSADWAYLCTGKIALDGATDPKLIFYHKAAQQSGAKIKVEVERPDGTTVEAGVVDYATIQGGEWIPAAISLADFANDDFVSVDFVVQANQGEVVYIDRMFIRDTYTYDLNAEISAPETIRKGEKAPVNVVVNNFGEKAARGYKVELYANGELVETVTPAEPLAAYAFTTVPFEFQTSVLDDRQSVELKAVVVYNNDLNPDDNAASTNLSYTVSAKPKPGSVAAQQVGEGVLVQWEAADASTKTTTESFESYTPWATDVFGEWKSVAKNTGTTGGPFSIQYPSQGTSFAFTLAAPLSGWLTEQQLESVPGFKAHTGDKYLAAFYRADDEGYYVAQDNWLFSPELSGEKQTVTFWVKNENDESTVYAETFDVLYSTTDREESSFTKLGNTHTTSRGAWEEVSVELPAGTKYFAINHNTSSSDAFVFMIDDVTYSYGPGAVMGYNVYRDGTLLGTTEADKLSFTDIKVEQNATYVYGVTAVYADEESEATVAAPLTTSIGEVLAAGKGVDVYTTDGVLVARDVRNFSSLKKGVYVVGGKKLIVK